VYVVALKGEAVKKLIKLVKRQPRPFKVNMARASANSFLTNLTKQYQSIYILRLGATPFQLGLVNGVGGIAGTVIAPPTGWLADKYGIRRIFLLATPVMVMSCLLFAIAPDWTMAIPAILLTFLATQMLSTACPMVCGSYLKNEERATGKQLCDTISAIPTLAAPIIAAVLITEFGGLSAEGISPLYFLQAIGFLIVSAFTYKFYFDTLNKQAALNPSFVEGVRQVFQRGVALKRWIVYIFLSSTSMYMSTTFLPAFVTEMKRGNEFVVGSMTTASLVLPLVLALFVGRLADTFGRKKVLYMTLPLYCTSILFLIYAQNTLMLLISGVLQGFYLLSAVTQGAITAELVPVGLLGKWYGILNLFRGIASITAPIIGGFIWTFIDPSYVFLFIILIEATKIIILWLIVPETLRTVLPV
jgi:MFS family permease